MRRRWLSRARWPSAVGKLDLIVMSAAFLIFGLSLIFQSHRWHATPAYHLLLDILPAGAWGALFTVSGAAMAVAVWQFSRRWLVIAVLPLALTLTLGWACSFVVRYLTSGSTTPETWVSWLVFLFLLFKVAGSIDRGPPLPAPGAEVGAFRRAIDNALSAAEEGLRVALLHALEQSAGKRREAVTAAVAAYGEALRAILPAGAMPAGDLARQAITEAHNALARAEEAYERSTGQPAPRRDRP